MSRDYGYAMGDPYFKGIKQGCKGEEALVPQTSKQG